MDNDEQKVQDMVVLRHCNLSVECPARCEFLREVPIHDSQDVIALCADTSEDGCPMALLVEHSLKH